MQNNVQSYGFFCIFARKNVTLWKIFDIMKRFWYFLACVLVCLSVEAQVKYIFYFIGDGMGANQVLMSEMYLADLEGKLGRNQLFMTHMPVAGMCATHSASDPITDSSAAGTTLATGEKTVNGRLGIGVKGDTLTTIAEELKREGWHVGVITTVAIDHATPAAFYAKSKSRNDYYDIGKQLVASDFDLFGGAGFHQPQPSKKDANLYDLAEKAGYAIAGGIQEAEMKRKTSQKLIVLQASDAADRKKECGNFPYAIDRKPEDMTLKELTAFSISYLRDMGGAFFLMVEGGMVDYAGHGRDGAAAIGETIDFDAAIGVAMDFYDKYPDETLILVTADHETGGMTPGNGGHHLDLQILRNQHCSGWVLSDALSAMYKDDKVPGWEQVKALLGDKLGFYREVTITDEEDAELQAAYHRTYEEKGSEVKTLYKDINQLSNTAIAILNKKAHVGWTSYSHTASPVPIFAIGRGAERFSGWHDNTELAPLLLKMAK